jgi:protein kinase A
MEKVVRISEPSTSEKPKKTSFEGCKFRRSCDFKVTLTTMATEFNAKYYDNQPSLHFNSNEFDVSCVLGAGAFGVVKLCKKKSTGQYLAMKVLSKEKIFKTKQIKHCISEKRILRALKFPFVMTMEGSYKDNVSLYLIMPFVNGGELFMHLRKARSFNEDQAKFYTAQIALALEYLHHCSLVYRDLKPENIMVDAQGYLKLTDFGFCKKIDLRTWTLCGTPEYLAPEIIQSKGYGKSCDWWSFGVFIYELVAGYSPFYTHSSNPMDMFEKIVAGKYKMPSAFSTDLKNLVQNILQVDLTRRYGNLKNGSNDIKQHTWFRTMHWISLLNREIAAPMVSASKVFDGRVKR